MSKRRYPPTSPANKEMLQSRNYTTKTARSRLRRLSCNSCHTAPFPVTLASGSLSPENKPPNVRVKSLPPTLSTPRRPTHCRGMGGCVNQRQVVVREEDARRMADRLCKYAPETPQPSTVQREGGTGYEGTEKKGSPPARAQGRIVHIIIISSIVSRGVAL